MGAMNSVRWALVAAACVFSVGTFAQTVEKQAKDLQPPVAPAPVQALPQAKPGPAEGAPAPAEAPAEQPAAPPRQVQSAQPPAAIPDGYKLNLLIRTTVIAVNQANKTGNYSVLRDLAAPGFQSANNPAQLAEIFSELRKKNVDLSPVLFYQPKFTSRPMLLPNGMLRVVGHFPSRPHEVSFDLIFEQVQGDWRHYGVSIGARAAPSPGAQATAPPDESGGPAADQSTATGGLGPAANTGKTAAQGTGVAPAAPVAEKGGRAASAPAPKAASKDAPAAAKPVSPPLKQGLGAPAVAP